MCSLEKEDTENWRAKVINAVIAGELLRAGITDIKPISVSQGDENCDTENWTWKEQDNWTCDCQGENQAPLVINDSTVK
jgi:hypothetical protein